MKNKDARKKRVRGDSHRRKEAGKEAVVKRARERREETSRRRCL